MRKKLVSIFLGVTMAAFFVGCQSAKTAENKKDNGKVDVTVSIEPLREFTEIVGGDKVNVKTMVPNGTEPHDFEPKTQDLLELNKAKVFVYNGLGMEHWKEQVLNTIENKDVKVVEASKGAGVLKEGDKVDPHLWLSLDGAKIEAQNIKDALVEVDSDNKSYYEENFKKFAEKLDSLANEYKEKFNGLANKDFDANFHQHVPFMEIFNKKNNAHLVKVAAIYDVYVGFYSKKYKSKNEIPNGAKVVVPNDPSNRGRALILLEKQGLIKLKNSNDLLSTVADIVENPKNLKISEVDTSVAARALDDVDLAVVNNTYAGQVGLNAQDNGVFVEDKDSPYVNIIVACTDNKDSKAIQDFVKAYQTEEVYQEAKKHFKDGVVKGW